MNYPDWESMKTAWDKEGTSKTRQASGRYDDTGNLVLSGKLGEAVVNNDFEAFTKAQISGKSDDGLTYQDMADFNEFVSEFFRIGESNDRKGQVYLVLIRKEDQASFGLEYHDNYGYNCDRYEDDKPCWDFRPMNPFTIQGYEPAE